MNIKWTHTLKSIGRVGLHQDMPAKVQKFSFWPTEKEARGDRVAEILLAIFMGFLASTLVAIGMSMAHLFDGRMGFFYLIVFLTGFFVIAIMMAVLHWKRRDF